MSILELFRQIESKNLAGPPQYLIVGLGNPGKKYETSRHNAGFLCIDYLAESLGVTVEKAKWNALYADCEIDGKRAMLLKPQTFMNNSGEAVRDAAAFYKIPPENIIVIFDDISLDPGRMRVRRKGTDGGHNGIKSIIYHLSSDNFPRIKIGIGGKPHPDYDLADYVLSSFSKEEQKRLFECFKISGQILPLIIGGHTERAMNIANGAGKEEK